MAKIFQADLILSILDRMSPGLQKAGRNVSRELNYIERSVRHANLTGFGMLAGFTGFAAVTSGLRNISSEMVKISRLSNEIAASSFRADKAGFWAIPGGGGSARIRDIEAATNAAKRYLLTVQDVLAEQEVVTRTGMSLEAARAVSGPFAAAAKMFHVTDVSRFARDVIGIMQMANMPMTEGKGIEKTRDQILDLLTAINQTQVGAEEFLNTMRFAGPALLATGNTIEDIAAFAIAGAKGNLRGSQLGVALRSMTVSMLNIKKEGREMLLKPPPGHTAVDIQQFIGRVPMTGQLLGTKIQKMFPEGAFSPEIWQDELNKIAGVQDKHAQATQLRQFMTTAVTGFEGETADLQNTQIGAAMMAPYVARARQFLMALQSAGWTPKDLPKIFQGRHLTNMITLWKGMIAAEAQTKALKTQSFKEAVKANAGIPLRPGETAGIGGMFERAQAELQKGPAGAMDRLETAMSTLAAALTTGPAATAMTDMVKQLSSTVKALEDIARAASLQAAMKVATEFAENNPWTAGILTGLGSLALGGVAGMGLSVARMGVSAVTSPFRALGWLFSTGGGEAAAAAGAGVSGAGAGAGTGVLARLMGGRAARLLAGTVLGPIIEYFSDIRPAGLTGLPGGDERFAPGMQQGRIPLFFGQGAGETNIAKQEWTKNMTDMSEKTREVADALEGLKGALGGASEADLFAKGASPMSGHLLGLPTFGGSTSSGGIRRRVGAGGRAYMAASTGGRAGVGGLEIAPGVPGIPVEGMALLDALARWESPGNPNFGFNTMFGNRQFADMSRHPGGPGVHTDAGRYQMLRSTWNSIRATHPDLTSFSAENQSKGAWYLAQRDYKHWTGRSLLTDLQAGDFERVKQGLGHTWVSLPRRHDLGSLYSTALSRRRTPLGAASVGGSGVSPQEAAAFNSYGMVGGDTSKLPPVQVHTEVNLDKEKVGSILTRHISRRGRRMATMDYPR